MCLTFPAATATKASISSQQALPEVSSLDRTLAPKIGGNPPGALEQSISRGRHVAAADLQRENDSASPEKY